MRTVALLTAMLAVAGVCAASDPIPGGMGSGPPRGGSGNRDASWSQPVDVNGSYVGSEVIGQFGLEDECADDFLVGEAGPVVLTHVTWWGGEYQYIPGDPEMSAFNLIFYNDNADPGLCGPADEPFTAVYGLSPQIETIFDEFGLALRKYDLDVEITLPGSLRLWLVAQASDHIYPPQWARFESLDSPECPAHFRSVFFGYPDWVPVHDLIGDFEGASFELTWHSEPTAVEPSSWGRIRALYR